MVHRASSPCLFCLFVCFSQGVAAAPKAAGASMNGEGATALARLSACEQGRASSPASTAYRHGERDAIVLRSVPILSPRWSLKADGLGGIGYPPAPRALRVRLIVGLGESLGRGSVPPGPASTVVIQ